MGKIRENSARNAVRTYYRTQRANVTQITKYGPNRLPTAIIDKIKEKNRHRKSYKITLYPITKNN